MRKKKRKERKKETKPHFNVHQRDGVGVAVTDLECLVRDESNGCTLHKHNSLELVLLEPVKLSCADLRTLGVESNGDGSLENVCRLANCSNTLFVVLKNKEQKKKVVRYCSFTIILFEGS